LTKRTHLDTAEQPTLFAQRKKPEAVGHDQLILYALGDFQARGKALAGRELPLDRLRGAVRRAAEVFEAEMLSDEEAVSAFSRIGAQVRQVPPFVAKHPFRITVSTDVAEHAHRVYQEFVARVRAEAATPESPQA